MYGLDKDKNALELYFEKMEQFDDYSIFVKAYKLFNKSPIDTPYKYTMKWEFCSSQPFVN